MTQDPVFIILHGCIVTQQGAHCVLDGKVANVVSHQTQGLGHRHPGLVGVEGEHVQQQL